VRSCAPDRATYLRRPDLGRQLDPQDAPLLQHGAPVDIALVVGDGLSSLAVQRHAVALLQALRERLPSDLSCSPVVIARQARVAIGDDIGEQLRARIGVVLIGERPGLSSPDSLGLYLTHAPRRGRHDAERNCISNVRPEGLPVGAAAHKLAWLIGQALQRGLTGVGLKDESDAALASEHKAAPLPPA
jgi:ethanolamine ammonia-lyase small subunit